MNDRRFRAGGLAGAGLLLALFSAPACAAVSVSVSPFTGGNALVSAVISSALASDLARNRDIKLVKPSMSARYRVQGSFQPVVGDILMQAKLVDAKSGAAVHASSETVIGPQAELPELVGVLARRLAQRLTGVVVIANRRAHPTAAVYSPVSGVVIDGRGLGLERSAAPRLWRADGGALWSPGIDTVVGYARTVDEAVRSGKVGRNPLVVKATARRRDVFLSDPVLSIADAELLKAAGEEHGLLDRGAVVILVDP